MGKVLLIGSSGLLGTELKKLNNEIITPTKFQADIRDIESITKYIYKVNPDVVINAAAIKDNRKIEQDPTGALFTNIAGAAHVAMACYDINCRLVFISTDYLYPGDHGNYQEDDCVIPCNLYAWTKLGGECAVKAVKNHLIIRTSFGPSKFDYPDAFVDKWTSKGYVDEIAPMILEASLSPLTGILNIGTERKTIYDHASQRNKVNPVKLADSSHSTPYDTSLNLQKWIDYKSNNPTAKPHTNCRVCGSDKLTKYLDLGLMPLANNLEDNSLRAREKERFPLQVMFCEECGLSQLSVVIDPGKMYSNYSYQSGVNAGYVAHCRKMAKDLQAKYLLDEDSFMIDIAGNDGTLLKEFREEIGRNVLNVDPAQNLAAISGAQGIPTIADFWGEDIAKQIKINHSEADLITATNVFAHVDNVREFIEAAKLVLKPDGVLVIECPYLIDFIENNEFDTVYFEHLSYFSIIPLNKLCSQIGMRIIDVEKQNIHGGTIRITVAKDSSIHQTNDRAYQFIGTEYKEEFGTIAKYQAWGQQVGTLISDFGKNILALKKQGFKIAAFAASAKGNTLLNACRINTDIIDYIVDETPSKIGRFSPGTGIPIVHKQTLLTNPPDYLLILSWNFRDAIIEKAREVGFKGQFIIPIPEFMII